MLLAIRFRRTLPGWQFPSLLLPPVPVRTDFDAERVAGCSNAYLAAEFSDQLVEILSYFLSSLLRTSSCKSANAFP